MRGSIGFFNMQVCFHNGFPPEQATLRANKHFLLKEKEAFLAKIIFPFSNGDDLILHPIFPVTYWPG